VAAPKPARAKPKIPKSQAQKEKERRDAFNERMMKAVEGQFQRSRGFVLPRPPDKAKK